VGIFARQSIQTISLQGLGIDIPGLPPSSQEGKVGPFGSMDARAVLSQDLFNLANVRSWQSYRQRRQSSSLLVANAREVVALNVVSAYLAALRSKATRDTLLEQQKLAQDLYSERVSQVPLPNWMPTGRCKGQHLEQQWQEASQNYVAAKLNLANMLQARITANFEVVDSCIWRGNLPDGDTAITTALATGGLRAE
jgi:hypothetical protein